MTNTTLGRPRTRPETNRINDERQRELARYYQFNGKLAWAKTALMNARRRAKRKGIGCIATLEDILMIAEQVTHCAITGVQMIFERGRGKSFSHTASIDRIDNTGIYEPGNIAILSIRGNTLKNNATIEEMLSIGEYARRIKALKQH